ncbi:hypothetical protein VNO77_38936 [Canavalia gladiata]|uniref:Uncharacterized protein n=1 Tax=Canavalia gladiata TaxID=3824 RepID=A0AAN9KBR8_CANGL
MGRTKAPILSGTRNYEEGEEHCLALHEPVKSPLSEEELYLIHFQSCLRLALSFENLRNHIGVPTANDGGNSLSATTSSGISKTADTTSTNRPITPPAIFASSKIEVLVVLAALPLVVPLQVVVFGLRLISSGFSFGESSFTNGFATSTQTQSLPFGSFVPSPSFGLNEITTFS